MTSKVIFFPVTVLVFQTFLIGLILVRMRFLAVKKHDINPKYFLLNRGAKVPSYLLQLEQNFNNLFELPVLFYLLVIVLFISNSVDMVQVILAWFFVVTRIFHSLIHITINKLRLRMTLFLSGGMILLVGWIKFLIDLV